jgi:dienelactone hydrolase
VLATEDRGSYQARKLSLNISADNRIGAYLLVPKGLGPFPAVVALHDHGAHFSIGKEKVVKPFGVSVARLADATDWVNKYYGGQWIGDRLAERGYVVLAIDVLFWGDRGRQEGIQYEAQQQLAANLLQLGVTWAGTNLWDDIRSAEFVQGLPEVDPNRIGCVGLSMGSNRSWHLAAATDIVRAGLAICWMGDTPTLMSEGNNQTTGQSAFSMIHPGIRNLLDFPDVACIACPKPMLFYNGTQDTLFPLAGVEACYARLHRVWQAQNAGDKLVTKLWPAPHEFNTDMQQEAFDWLDKQLKKP